jgi:hypothetical protein
MDEREPALLHQPVRYLDRLVVVPSFLHEHGAEAADGRVFLGVVAERHAYGDRDAEPRTGVGEAQAVIAAGGRHHAAPPLLLGERGERRQSVPHLEGAGWLQVLVLHDDADPVADDLVEGGVRPRRRWRQMGSEAPLRFVNVLDRDGPRHGWGHLQARLYSDKEF